MRYGFWLPVFGGWLLNVEKEPNMEATFSYMKDLAQHAEKLGYDATLIAELFINGYKGHESPSLDAWTTAAALAAVTEKLQIITAMRPVFHKPAITAKMAANIDHISQGRLAMNVVPGWWREELKQFGGDFTEHEKRYDRMEEFIEVLKGIWQNEKFSYNGEFYEVQNTQMFPKPIQKPHPFLYAGGESEKGRQVIATHCDGFLLHGHSVEEAKIKIEDMKKRRKQLGKQPFASFGMAAYVICRDTEEEAQKEYKRITTMKNKEKYAAFQNFESKTKEEQKIIIEDFSVSNRTLRPNFVGTPEQIAKRILQFEKIGIDLLLLQCSPQKEELERFAKQVMPVVEKIREEIE